jgi:hypothetical protein
VELAVVMIIIGLLIGGVLKGQELIANAEVTSTIAQVKGFDAATSTFQDKYDAMPGDMLAPAARLPNCGACLAGGGDGRVGTGAGGVDGPMDAPGAESASFFVHLAAADLVTGIAQDGTGAFGDIYPEAEVGGGWHAAYWGGGALGAAANARQGHYLTLTVTAGAAPGAAQGTLITPNQAFRIDNKIDDGNPQTGTVFPTAAGGAGTECVLANVYAEALDSNNCEMVVRFQN